MMKEYEIFKTQLETDVTTSNQDIGMIYYIMKDVFGRVERAYYTAVQSEYQSDIAAFQKGQAQQESHTSPNSEEEDAAKESE